MLVFSVRALCLNEWWKMVDLLPGLHRVLRNNPLRICVLSGVFGVLMDLDHLSKSWSRATHIPVALIIAALCIAVASPSRLHPQMGLVLHRLMHNVSRLIHPLTRTHLRPWACISDFPKYYWQSIVEKKVHRKDYECHSIYRFILLEPLPEPLTQYSSPLLQNPCTSATRKTQTTQETRRQKTGVCRCLCLAS